ncbi:MAG TPA: zf-HC2 domain-containing protein [Gemmatimonadaceae bacterium]|nr:zf-HC2 domain-containing protein [Gemmatimonadaceae bacterium]
MRDLLPDFVNETLPERERAMVAGHVAACADCAAEIGLIRSARAAYPAPPVRVARIVAALPSAASIEHRRPRPPAPRRWLVAAAAAIVLVGGVTVLAHRDVGRGGDRGTLQSTASTAANGRRGIGSGGFTIGGESELNSDQLRSLLRAIDTVSVLPSTEPETSRHPQGNQLGEVIN